MSKSVTSANQQNDALFVLIKSLTKSEKRQFNLYVGRLGGNIDAKFFSLFKFFIYAIKLNSIIAHSIL